MGAPAELSAAGGNVLVFRLRPEQLLCGAALQGTERKQKAQAGAVAAVQGEPTVAKLQHSPDRRSGAQLETGVGAGSILWVICSKVVLGKSKRKKPKFNRFEVAQTMRIWI